MLDVAPNLDDLDFGDMFSDELIAGSAAGALDALVARAYPDDGWAEYRNWIEFHGNPPDQIERFENAGIIMQPKQLEFCSWARRMDNNIHIDGEKGAPEIGIGGARGPGKSFVVFAQAAIDDCARFAGCKVLYLRKVGKKAREQMLDLTQAVLGHTKHTPTDGLIRFPNGSRIIMGHFNHEKEVINYLGMGYEIIIVEEFTSLSKRVRQSLRDSNRTSMDMVPRMYNSTNPMGIGHQWYKKLFIIHERKYGKIMDRRRKFIQATVYDNKFVNADYIGNLEENTGAELRAYLYGDWDVSAGAYFEQWDYDLHTVDEITELAVGQPIWASMDYGLKHWNVIHFHTKHDGVIYTFHELCHREHYASEIVPDIKSALALYGRRLHHLEKFLVGSDVFARRGEAKKTVAQQYADLKIKMTAAITGPGSRIARAHHMSRLLGNPKRGIKPGVQITRNCPRLIDTLPYLERDPNNPEDVHKVDMSDDGEGGDDAYDSWCYGIYTGKTRSGKTTIKRSGF